MDELYYNPWEMEVSNTNPALCLAETMEGTTLEQEDFEYKVGSEVTPKQREEAQELLFKTTMFLPQKYLKMDKLW
ncbi:5714_t:CDS:1, partial [Gigaspora margarita]